MIDVHVNIAGIIMYCDESIAHINMGKNYYIQQLKLEDLPFKEDIVDGKGNLNTDYYGSRLIENGRTYFMCLTKEEDIQVEEHQVDITKRIFTDEDFAIDKDVTPYMDDENSYLNEVFNLLRLFKGGNIGLCDVFFTFIHQSGIVKNTCRHRIHQQTRNVIDGRPFVLNKGEVRECNAFLKRFIGKPYELLKNNVEKFSWGQEQIDIGTGFEQYITALEMTLLNNNDKYCKKERLSKRVAVIIGDNPSDIDTIYQRMKKFYKYRSESLHEGVEGNITVEELHEMEDIVRNVLKWSLDKAEIDFLSSNAISTGDLRTKIIDELKQKVTAENASGTFTQTGGTINGNS